MYVRTTISRKPRKKANAAAFLSFRIIQCIQKQKRSPGLSDFSHRALGIELRHTVVETRDQFTLTRTETKPSQDTTLVIDYKCNQNHQLGNTLRGRGSCCQENQIEQPLSK